MILMPCPFLKQTVRMSAEREAHVLSVHSELAPDWPALLAQTLDDPDELRWSDRDEETLLFGRWYPELLDGKHVIVVVVLDASGGQQPWIVTAFIARRWPAGVLAWRRS